MNNNNKFGIETDGDVALNGEDNDDSLRDLAMPNLKIGGIGPTLPNTLQQSVGCFGNALAMTATGDKKMNNIETQVGYGQAKIETCAESCVVFRRKLRSSNKAHVKNLMNHGRVGGGSIPNDGDNCDHIQHGEFLK